MTCSHSQPAAPHPVTPHLLLITHYFICFLLLSLCSWPLNVPKEHYSAMGEVAKPLCHLTEALQPRWALARRRPRLCHWRGHVSLGIRGHMPSPPLHLQGSLPEAARLCDSENVHGPVVEFSGCGPSFEEERPYFPPHNCG